MYGLIQRWEKRFITPISGLKKCDTEVVLKISDKALAIKRIQQIHQKIYQKRHKIAKDKINIAEFVQLHLDADKHIIFPD